MYGCVYKTRNENIKPDRTIYIEMNASAQINRVSVLFPRRLCRN